ncbi:MAG: alternative ribosome rescue aminoacyl-tRNA hydrolase ArfB [Ignavibacteriales bacterium]|nr:alternative ribosome rescue aminoacyl-tRNA hydrolase ArfB [Ignavibacteriales bacterium]
MIRINKHITIKESELIFNFIRSSGPGGQNVNKVSTAVQLRFAISSSESLSEDVKRRLKSIAGRKVTKDDVLIIEARRFRTQEANRQDAISRLIELIDKASKKRKQRIKTNPTAGSKVRRIETKKKLGEKKRLRKYSDQS